MEPQKVADCTIEPVEFPEVSKSGFKKFNQMIPKLILICLQVLIAICVCNVMTSSFLSSVFQTNPNNNLLTIINSIIGPLCAFLILTKYQLTVEEFSFKSDKIEKQISERTGELLRVNNEMKREIADRSRIEAALAESEARYRTIIKESALGIALIDMTGSLIEWNPALQSILGYSHDEMGHEEYFQFLSPKDSPQKMKAFRELVSGKRRTLRFESSFIRKNGKTSWWRQSLSLVREIAGEPSFIIAIVEDVTERKQAEEQIRKYQERLQSLASELSLTEERERRNLAELLHDQIGQILSFAKIKLDELQDSNLYKRLKAPIFEIHRLIESSIRITRSLIFELSPPVLYDVGLEAAVEWLGENLEKQHHLPIQVVDDNLVKPLKNEKRIVMFRAVRELLVNAIKHAKATMIKVYLQRKGEFLEVTIEDNGVGFPDEKISDKQPQFNELSGYGLFSVRERMIYYGGKLEIESNPGRANRVILTIPLELAEEDGLELTDGNLVLPTIPSVDPRYEVHQDELPLSSHIRSGR